MTSTQKRKLYILALAWASAALFVWPILEHHAFRAPSEWKTRYAIRIGAALAAFLSYRFYRAESRRLDRSRNLILVLLIFLVTCFVNQIHYYFVDQGNSWSSPTNTVWQERLQINVSNLSPAVLPHSYRFLPNGIVLWMQICRIRFDAARDIYRFLTGLLLFYAIYRFARLYTDYLGGVLAILLVAVVYPMSFEAYAGQLTDPLSHLSFVLAFIFLETGDFAFLLSTLMIGSLAKETVLALTGFYVLFCRRQKRYWIKALVLCLGTLVSYFGVRLLVLHSLLRYQQVSAGLTPDHPLVNLATEGWPLAILVLFAYTVFLVLGWKETPVILKRLFIYVTPILIGTNFIIGWLRETRNYMPAVFVLSVIAARYISRRVGIPEAPSSLSTVN